METRVLSLPMALFAEGGAPQSDPLAPRLKGEEEVKRYGEALTAGLKEILEGFKGRTGWMPKEWVLTGEGVDFSLLRDRLKPEEGVVTISPSPGEFMAECLRERVSPWLGPCLSVPIGLLMDGGMST